MKYIRTMIKLTRTGANRIQVEVIREYEDAKHNQRIAHLDTSDRELERIIHRLRSKHRVAERDVERKGLEG